MTSRELERQKSVFQNKVNKVLDSYRNIILKIGEVDEVIENNEDSLLRKSIPEKNQEIINRCNNAINRITNHETRVINTLNNRIEQLKLEEQQKENE